MSEKPIILSESLEYRFNLRRHKTPTESGCLGWVGAHNSDQYPVVHTMVEGKKASILAHRVAYAIHTGEDLVGMEVRHTCGNRWCVNHNHLVVKPSTRGRRR